MHASRFLGLIVFGTAGTILLWGTGCSIGESGGGSSGGEVSAAVHDLVCGDMYCYCVRDGWDEALCRDVYCKGGSGWDGKDSDCKDILSGSGGGGDGLKCGQTYCDCQHWPGTPEEKNCEKYCEGGTNWDGTDVECDPKPDEPKCDPGYCDCVEGGQPEPKCRAVYCHGQLPDIACPDTPGCENLARRSTDWAILTRASTIKPQLPSKPWSDVHDTTNTDRQGGSVILQPGEISDFLVLRNAPGLKIPANAERIVSVAVQGRLKASPGYARHTANAWLVGPSGSSNESVRETIYSHNSYDPYFFENNPPNSLWGGFKNSSTISVSDARSPQFGVCYRMGATEGLTRAAVDSTFIRVSYEICLDPPN